MYTSPPIVIDNGSDTTKAGFASEELPSLVFNTNYLVGSDGKVIVGDDQIDKFPENEVYTLMDNGTIYDFDHIVQNWEYVYDHLDNDHKIDSKEFPLTMTEASWNSKKNKLKTCELAFETLQVPLFSLVKKPLCQLYHMNRSNGLVIDIGSSTTTITPILDGIVQDKSSYHSKFAGDFVDANIMDMLLADSNIQFDWLPSSATDSFKNYQISKKVLQDFKLSMLNVSDYPINPQAVSNQLAKKHYQLPNKQYVNLQQEQVELLETLFQPNLSKLNPNPVTFDKPNSNGISLFILSTLKALEAQVLTAEPNNFNKFNDILRNLLSNILITGDCSLLTGLQRRIINDLYHLTSKYFPNYVVTQPHRLILNTLNNYQITDINETWEKKFNTWLGASDLSLMINDPNSSTALDNWFVTKQDYQELGEDYLLERFK